MNKGWKRLLIAASGLWLAISSLTIMYERESINSFDKYVAVPSSYYFYSRTFVDPFKTETKQKNKLLTANKQRILIFVIGPILALWFFAFLYIWVRDGFKQSQ